MAETRIVNGQKVKRTDQDGHSGSAHSSTRETFTPADDCPGCGQSHTKEELTNGTNGGSYCPDCGTPITDFDPSR